QAEVAGYLAAIGAHGDFDSAWLGVGEYQGMLRQADGHWGYHRERTNLFAVHAIHVAILHWPFQFKFRTGHLHTEMRRESRIVLRQSDVAGIAHGIERAVLGLFQPIRLGV